MFATLDIGNTKTKATFFRGDEAQTVFTGSLKECFSECHDRGVIGGAVCTTVDLPPSDLRLIEEDPRWWIFSSECRLPITVDYTTPHSLGSDRLCGVLGAYSVYGGVPAMVADAGTALTVDVLAAGGRYVGGNISPGLEMRFKALNSFTSRLPLLTKGPVDVAFGDSTESAIRCGAERGLAYEIAGSFVRARREYGCKMLVLTGGDADFIRNYVEEILPEDGAVVVNPCLVAYGLKKAYEYNNE